MAVPAAIRLKLSTLLDDMREIRDHGKKAVADANLVWLFSGMMNSLPGMFEAYNNMYHELCSLTNEGGDLVVSASDHASRTSAKRYYHESNGYFATLNEAKTNKSASQGNASTSCGMFGSPYSNKLPTLNLPNFKGERIEWPHFKDTFCSLVKDDPQLKDISKFHYLVRSLGGAALAVIAPITVTEANFEVAWETLCNAYGNERLLATAYLDKLLELKRFTTKPNAAMLSKVIAELSESVAAFSKIDIPDRLEFMYFYLASRCLDTTTKEQFELQNNDTFPTFKQLLKYLRNRCTAAELATGLPPPPTARDISSEKGNSRQWRPTNKSGGDRVALVTNMGVQTSTSTSVDPVPSAPMPSTSSVRSNSSCYVCKGPHTLLKCLKFNNASVTERHQFLRSWKGCRNCLFSSHNSFTCSSSYRCRYCGRKHHSLLHGHPFTPKPSSSPGSSTIRPPATRPSTLSSQPAKPASLNTIGSNGLEVMLGTVICHIRDQAGQLHTIRLAIDSGSHFSFITKSFTQRLGLPIEEHAASLWGIGETPFTGFKGRTQCSLYPKHDEVPELSTTALVVDTITSPLPGFDSTQDFWQSYFHYPLADPEFWVTRPIDFLLGCDLFPEILNGQMITLSETLPKLMGTVFGFVVIGRIRDISEASSFNALHSSSVSPRDSLHDDLERFWELEEPPPVAAKNPEDERCELLFRSNHSRLPSGRYVVRLPFKANPPKIYGTYNQALRRLEHLESKLERNSTLRTKYHEFMYEYLELGHMELAKQAGKVLIPHHCVVKHQGEDIKVRVVFDASASTASGSLNDFLLIGPKLQSNMVNILLNFRRHKFVFTTDVVKMFRQVLVHEEDRVYQHILWRFNPAEAVQEYELKTVSYGTAPAPYLAIRALKQLVEDHGSEYPLAARAIATDMYVDDLVTGASSLKDALELQSQVIKLMAKGEFQLGKWAANHTQLLDICTSSGKRLDSSSILEPVSLEAGDDTSIKILGLQWDPSSDSFSYKIGSPGDTCTKRAVLSAITKIYDPLGYIGPVVVSAKILIQKAWKLKLSWDKEFPTDMREEWLHFVQTLPSLSIQIPRWGVSTEGPYDILVFADASERAYCAAAYLRSPYSQTCHQVHLLLAKTKLSPVKPVTIPRLELCAALLAARLWQSLRDFCNNLSAFPRVFFFSDSSVTLSWLGTPPYKLKTFVANRVTKINELTVDGSWQHVASADNPSDLGSRGVSPGDLLNCRLWFHGPEWAVLEPSQWPTSSPPTEPEVPELKFSPSGHVLLSSSPPTPLLIEWFSSFSDFNQLIRSFAYLLRFCNRLLRHPFNSGNLQLGELRKASNTAVQLVQRHAFFNDKVPSSTTPIPRELFKLHPFLDEAGLLLVGGRLRHSKSSWNTKHPMLLPRKSPFAKLIVRHYHRTLLHPGPTLLLGVLRTKYWIVGARDLVHRVTHECVTCRRHDAAPLQPPMGDLPAIRFGEGRAFLHVGVDFAGPFFIRDSLRRKASSSKAYLCVFICLSTKAMHLELVSSLSTSAFCAALDRFIGRRGLPEQILSDNGSNFVGAANEFRELYQWYNLPSTQQDLQLYACQKELKWVFTPPRAPSFGGIFEAGVKSVKRLMRSIYGDNIMCFEELSTWLIKIEAILNSRPLCPLTPDPNDINCLTPGHFLIGCPLLSAPEKSLFEVRENRLSRWQLVQQKAEHFWKRWRIEYLTTLQERTKWCRPSYCLQVGDLVLIKDENAPRLRWPMGRVIEVHPGSDEVVRVATVKTHNTVLKRPATKLIPLFMPESELNPKIPKADNPASWHRDMP